MSQQDVEVTDAEEVLDGAEDGQDADADPGTQLSDLELEGDIAADYVEGLLDIADLDGDIDMDVEGERAIVSVVGATLDELVGDDGAVLEALQELTRLAVHRQTGNRARLMLDIGGYRARRRRAGRLRPERGRGGRAHRRAEDPGRHDALRAEGRARRSGRGRPAQRVGGRGAEPASGGLPGAVTAGWRAVAISIARIMSAGLSILISLRTTTRR